MARAVADIYPWRTNRPPGTGPLATPGLTRRQPLARRSLLNRTKLRRKQVSTRRERTSIGSRGDQPHAVVFPDEWCGAMPVSIENANRVSFGHNCAYLGFPHPAESGNF